MSAEISGMIMIVVGFVGAIWFAYLFVRGRYESALPALLCFSASLLEISWMIHPEVNVYRNLAWNVNSCGLIWLLIKCSLDKP